MLNRKRLSIKEQYIVEDIKTHIELKNSKVYDKIESERNKARLLSLVQQYPNIKKYIDVTAL